MLADPIRIAYNRAKAAQKSRRARKRVADQPPAQRPERRQRRTPLARATVPLRPFAVAPDEASGEYRTANVVYDEALTG